MSPTSFRSLSTLVGVLLKLVQAFLKVVKRNDFEYNEHIKSLFFILRRMSGINENSSITNI